MHPKYLTYKDKSYLDWIRAKDCAVCGNPPRSDAHHVWHTGKKNYGNDALAIPLCREHHTSGQHAYHRLGHEKFELFWNIDLKDTIICYLIEFIQEVSPT